MDAGIARRRFFAAQAGKRYARAKTKDPAGVGKFEALARSRRGKGKRNKEV